MESSTSTSYEGTTTFNPRLNPFHLLLKEELIVKVMSQSCLSYKSFHQVTILTQARIREKGIGLYKRGECVVPSI